MFQFGAIVALGFLPLVWWCARESIAFEMQRRRPDALAAINAMLARMGRRPVDALPPVVDLPRKAPLAALFSHDLARRTILMTIAAMAISLVLIVAFGHGRAGLGAMATMAAATDFAIGVGRGGSALAPALAGFMFASGIGLQAVAIVMATGSLIALLALAALPATHLYEQAGHLHQRIEWRR